MDSHSNPPAAPPPVRLGYALALLVLVALGMAGNYYKFTLFYNADFIFGSVFGFLVLQLAGARLGTVAALLISLPLFLLWGHPWAVVIMTAEVAAVGWLQRRRGLGLIQADALFWLCLGMPLVFGFYRLVMKTPLDSTLFVMAKDTINGLANVLAARLLYLAFCLGTRRGKVPTRDILYLLLAMFVLCPGLVMIAMDSRRDLRAVDVQVRYRLVHDGRSLAYKVDAWLHNRRTAVVALAELASARPVREMQDQLAQARRADDNLLRLGLHGPDGTVLAHDPPLDDQGQSAVGRNFGDRPYLQTMRRTLQPILSEPVLGRLGQPAPMVALVAPVTARGEYRGYVLGALDLRQVQEMILGSLDPDGALVTLTDTGGKVITSNRTDQKPLADFRRGAGTLVDLGAGVSQWLPPARANSTAMTRWGRSFYVAEYPVGNMAGWRLVLEQPVAPFQKQLFDAYSRKLAMLLVMVLGSLAVAEIASRRSSHAYEQLAALTHDLPLRLAGEGFVPQWPESKLLEPSQLVANFRTMVDALEGHYRQVSQVNERLELAVAERTRDLRDSEGRFRMVFEGAPMGIAIVDSATGRFLSANPSLAALLEATPEQLQERTFMDYTHPDHLPGDLESVRALAAGDVPEVEKEKRYLLPSGATVWVRLRMVRLPGVPARHLSLVEDITERKRAEAALRDSEARFRVMAEESPAGLFLHRDGRFLYANPAGVRLLKAGSAAEIVGLPVLDLVHPEDRELVQGRIRAALEQGHEPPLAEERLLCLDGSPLEAAVISRAVTFEGQPTILVFVQDIGLRRQALENEIRARKAESLVLMAGSIAHDFNNLFQALLGSLGLLELTCRDQPGAGKHLATAKDVLHRAIALSWKMLDFSGRAVARLRSLELAELVTAWAEGLEPRERAALDLDLDAVPLIQGDPDKLNGVLQELLANALEAMAEAGTAGGRVRLRLFVDFGLDRPGVSGRGLWPAEPPAAPATVCLEVSSDGPVPGPEVLARMFDPFYTTRKLGRGLGLPSVLGLLQAHGAGLHVLPDPAKGLVFRIHFAPMGA